DSLYFPCIQETVKELVRLFPDLLHSVYVYGSVARGEAIVGKSDLDLLVMFNDTLGAEELAELKTVTNDLSRTYHSLVRDVGIAVADVEYVIDPANYYEQAFIKELCVCVHGEDRSEEHTSELQSRFDLVCRLL